jgi:predicted GIY-YIG superfamily endonuclease
MKTCTKCKQTLPLDSFHKDKTRVDGLMYRCKECINNQSKKYYYSHTKEHNQRTKKWHQLQEDNYHYVYLLPDYNYVGVTDNPYFRMADHKFKHNRNTNWVELARYNNRQEALAHESRLHNQGYNGINKNYTKCA